VCGAVAMEAAPVSLMSKMFLHQTFFIFFILLCIFLFGNIDMYITKSTCTLTHIHIVFHLFVDIHKQITTHTHTHTH